MKEKNSHMDILDRDLDLHETGIHYSTTFSGVDVSVHTYEIIRSDDGKSLQIKVDLTITGAGLITNKGDLVKGETYFAFKTEKANNPKQDNITVKYRLDNQRPKLEISSLQELGVKVQHGG